MIQNQILNTLGLDLSSLTQANLLELLCKSTVGPNHTKNAIAPQQQTANCLIKSQQDQINSNQQQQSANRYKTELCRSFQESGQCKYGDKCQFAHGMNEMRNMVRHPKYKTELCRTFHATGYCPYGPRCHFVHDTSEAHKKDTRRVNTSHGSSNSSSESVSPQQQPKIDTEFNLDLLSFKLTETQQQIKQSHQQTSSLLMVAPGSTNSSSNRDSFSSSSSSTSSSQKSSRLNSIDSVFSAFGGDSSASSSRSLSPDAFLLDQNQLNLNTLSNTNDLYFSSTNDLFYSLLNQRTFSSSSSSSNSSSSSSSLHSSCDNFLANNNNKNNNDLLVNQILSNIYLNDSTFLI
jgi:hypothetical protein